MQRVDRATREGRLARDQLPEDQPERVDVGLLGRRVAEHQLGRHISRLASEQGRVGDLRGRLVRVGDRRRLERGREAEVEHVRVALLIEQHSGGLESAVQDPARVGGGDGLGDLLDQGARAGPGQATRSREQLVERIGLLEPRHDQEESAVEVLAVVGQVDGAAVLDLGAATSREEAIANLGAAEFAIESHQADAGIGRAVFGLIDLAEPAAACETNDAISVRDDRVAVESVLGLGRIATRMGRFSGR